MWLQVPPSTKATLIYYGFLLAEFWVSCFSDHQSWHDCLLLFIMIGTGLHHFYLGNFYLGLQYILTLGYLGAGWASDLCLMRNYVREANAGDSKKTVWMAYLLSIPPGGLLGLHHFYLGRTFFGVLWAHFY